MKLKKKNKILLLAIIFLVILSGCVEEKTININKSNTNDTSADSPVFQDMSREGSGKLNSENATTPSEDGENISEFTPEFTLESFTGIYVRDNHNKNPRPLFIWENVPGNDSSILRDYIKKRPGFEWVDNAPIIKTDELMFVWDDVPGNGSESLIELLTNNYGIAWAPDRKIEKREDGNRIDVSIEKRNISFVLNDDKTRALMEIDNVRTEELKVKHENGIRTIYRDNGTIHIGDGIKISLFSNFGAFLDFGDGGGISFPVQEKNGKHIVYDIESLQSHNISERRYAVYNLSIKNNGSNTFRVILSKLSLISGKCSSNPASMIEIPAYLFDEIRLEDVSLLPGQITKGYVAFDVDPMYDKSFLLMYNSKPVELTSFENSVLSIEKADLFDYSIAMGKPPYHVNNDFGASDTYDPPQPEFYTDRRLSYSLIWSNWANRSVVEFFKKLDLKELNNIKGEDDLPATYSTYALKVIPGKNISIHHGNPLVVTGEKNEELISAHYSEIAVSDNSTFKRFHDNFTGEMNFSNATLVKIFFDNVYGWDMASRINRNDQVVVMNENGTMVFIGFHYGHFVS